MARRKAKVAMITLFVGEVMIILCHYYLLVTFVSSTIFLFRVECSNISRDDPPRSSDGISHTVDSEDEHEEHSHSSQHRYDFAPSRSSKKRNKKRLFTNTKLFYFLQNPRRLSTSESQYSADYLADRSEYGYGGGHESPHSYKTIHIHSSHPPMQYHEEKSKEKDLWPLLLLSCLPILFGSLILLPLLLSFFTQVLQLMAMMQNTMNNMSTTTAASTGRRKRRYISALEMKYFPYITEEAAHLLAQRLSQAWRRFGDFDYI